MLRLVAAATFFASVAGQAGQAECDAGSKCSFTTTYKGKAITFDLRGLCNAGSDYTLEDALGHKYYAQVCGTAGKSCLPQGWENEYEYGRVVQTWGSVPACDNSCVEERTGAPTCCSESCQVIAVRDPLFSTIVAGDPSQGIALTYYGETPTSTDPYPCDYNPATGQPFPRVTHMQFFCDPSATGFANFYEVDQNSTDDCDYTLKFKTNAVCIPGLSGGWIFIIIVGSTFAAYALIGTLVTYWREKIWAFPNRHFWAEFESLVFDGVRFIGAGFRKPAARAKGFGAITAPVLDGGDAVPLASAGNPFGTTAASSSSSGGGGGGSGYQTIGATDGAPAAARGSAYTDL